MLTYLPRLLLAAAVCGEAIDLQPGVQLTYKGSVAQLDAQKQPQAAGKTFDLTLVFTASDADHTEVCWLVDESGSGGWPWTERFGVWNLDASLQGNQEQGPALLYDWNGGRTAVNLWAPFLVPKEPLQAGANFSQGDLTFEVDQPAQVADRNVWQIEAKGPYGRKRRIALERDGNVVVGFQERVFMGQGVEYELSTQLVAVQQLAEADLAPLRAGWQSLVELRNQLNKPARSEDPALTVEQRTILKEQLPAIAKATAAQGLLAGLLQAAEADLNVQHDRAEDIAQLSAKHVGQQIGTFTAKELSGESLSNEDLAGQVTILHFWHYRDEPLEEPYGQVGYLDFLYDRRKSDVKVYGVAVDGRLGDQTQRSAALRGIRKLKSFMNLSYPVLLDSGELVKLFGDPQSIGADLPLFVVIDGGKIVHYHVGCYEADRDQGLKELDAAVTEAIKNHRL